jgi:transcriptional regulator with XRE-family HTH domain
MESLRTCRVCKRDLPVDRFHGDDKHRRRVCRRCFADQEHRQRRQQGSKRRMPRFNARGDAHCSHCRQYLPIDSFKPHPNRPGVLWTTCKPCTRELDRARYARKTSTLEGAIAEQEKNNARRRELRARRRQERLQFVQHSIKQLRARGLTKSEIARLGGFSMGSLLRWEAAKLSASHGITENVERRFGVLMNAAIQILPSPSKYQIPNYRRRVPHPDLPILEEMCESEIERYPLRNAWINGKRDHQRRAA